ncbi:acetate/propionate family kinase [Pyxidicoccus sp. MSG2]|uniref:acetate/propionate family kinase n=1 Tax=Pyxidicoccus sp. MSG2 TaxID=2996790 RepID=UPI00226EAE82|nr:acetate/propionate family kinase [Pyxidicoccus sp. MSG2]MCY1015869.1 acetate/propionate family kinase [Pyxidicoccus sp. MSG2]
MEQRPFETGDVPDALLVLNAGSSSLKFSVFLEEEPLRLLLRGEFEELSTHPRFVAHAEGAVIGEKDWAAGTRLGYEGATDFLFTWGRGGVLGGHRIAAVGHRVVHGGMRFSGPALIDAATLEELEALIPLAPLHQPHCVEAIRAVMRTAPWVPQVACFDTAFHRTQPPVAQAFALPRRYAEEGIRRYGFHGLSYEYIASTLPRTAPAAAEGRTVVAHLGNGASLCALLRGRSVATTMGLTALDGLMMGTRCGAIDPGVLLYLMDRHGMDARALERLLYQQSGLLGVSGESSDMRELLDSTSAAAAEALELFVYRIHRELASLAAALHGLDAVVFTGGIGEHAAPIRERVCRAAGWLGLELDEEANARGGPCITRPGSRVSAWVIPTDEETMIAHHTRRVLSATSLEPGPRAPGSR